MTIRQPRHPSSERRTGCKRQPYITRKPFWQGQTDRNDNGENHVTPAAAGVWSSFTKTQYANDPSLGGWSNFVKAHLSVLAICEHMQSIGFAVHVTDEGDFWETRNLETLAKAIGDYDALVAGLAGALKDAAAAQGMVAESAMDGRPDFERLEMQGNATIDRPGKPAKESRHLVLALRQRCSGDRVAR